MALLITGALISPVDQRNYNTIPSTLIYVGHDGIIKAINEIAAGAAPTTPAVIDAFLQEIGHTGPLERLHLARGEFLIPGFIDTHTHAPQYPCIGSGQQYELLEWLEEIIFPMEAKFKDAELARKAYTKIVNRFIDAGTTTCCYYGTLHVEANKELATIIHRSGQRAFVGKCNMDRNSPSYYVEKTDESLPDTEKVIKHIKSLPPSKDGSPYVYPILTPRFAIATTDELLKKLRGFVDSNPSLAIQTHISENPSEIAYTKELFKHLSEPGKPITYAGVYDHYHLLRKNTILAHGVHLEEAELKLIKEKEAGISHCPTSNFNLTSGVANVGVLLDRKIKVGLGTDVSGGFAPSILRTIQHASIAAKVLTFTSQTKSSDPDSFAYKPLKIETLFWLATLGGAQVCDLEHKVGSLEVGKAFDAIVVDVRNMPVSPPQNPNLWGVEDDRDLVIEPTLDAVLERFLFCGDDRNLRRVYVQGRWIGGTEFRGRCE